MLSRRTWSRREALSFASASDHHDDKATTTTFGWGLDYVFAVSFVRLLSMVIIASPCANVDYGSQ
jgi:hypothetical protein